MRMDSELRGADTWFRYRLLDIRQLDGERYAELADDRGAPWNSRKWPPPGWRLAANGACGRACNDAHLRQYKRGVGSAYFVSGMSARLGRREEALAYLRLAIQRREIDILPPRERCIPRQSACATRPLSRLGRRHTTIVCPTSSARTPCRHPRAPIRASRRAPAQQPDRHVSGARTWGRRSFFVVCLGGPAAREIS